jgi:hypothetical protein
VETEARAGRICPRDYTYAPSVFARVPDFAAETLYAIGGLYGNLSALAAIERLAAAERTAPAFIFNGDFHWFDAEADWFAEVERGVSPHRALRGNVETEIARSTDVGAGCGCAYPDNVDAGIVDRSNSILRQLRTYATPGARTRLGSLPMHVVAQVGTLRIGVVHGDAGALAGWRFSHEALDQPANKAWLNDVRAASQIDVFASTHTCLPALRDFDLPAGRMRVVNNGAAGMPNFAGTRCGVITRIATTPSPYATLYGLQRNGVFADALAVHYEEDAFLTRFLARWPQGSAAYLSYFSRLTEGPDYDLAQARPR